MRVQEQSKAAIVTDQTAGVQSAGDKKTEDIIQVYVTGAVTKPGVYRLEPGARVYQAIDMAGSLPTANLKNINLALKLEDGQAIIVPAAGEETSGNILSGITGSGSSASNLNSNGKVNINSASVQELDQKLPGIGPAIAQRIVEYRTSQGAFSKIEDLTSVSGIGDKKFAQLKDLITVR
jgi:competence protein ComEA